MKLPADLLCILLKTYAAFLPANYNGSVILRINYHNGVAEKVVAIYEEAYKID